MAYFPNLKKAVAFARSYSKRHMCGSEVWVIVKGKSKGSYQVQTPDELDNPYQLRPPSWGLFPSDVPELLMTYEDGKKIKPW